MTTRVILNSHYRTSGTNDIPTFTLQNVGVSARTVYINSINIPHTFYNITYFNWEFFWKDSLDQNINTEIPIGNYTLTQLLTELGNQMTTDATDGLTYTASVDVLTQRVSITNSGPTSFTIRPNPSGRFADKIRGMLGFRDADQSLEDLNGDNFRTATSLFGSKITAFDTYFIGKQAINIRSNVLASSKNYQSILFSKDSASDNIKPGKNDIVATIPITTDYGDIISYNVGNGIVKMNVPSNITNISFELLDEHFKPLELRGRSWTIELIFQE